MNERIEIDSIDANRATAVPVLYRLCALGTVLVAIVIAEPFAFHTSGDNVHILLSIITALIALAAVRVAERVPIKKALWVIGVVALLTRIYLVITEPLLSSDIYRYVWDGWVQGAGINPYRYVPADPALAFLRDAAVYPNINRAQDAVTIYPPVAQMFFFVVTQLGGGVTAMKAALVGCEFIVVAAIGLLLARLEQPLTRVVAYLWHPLPIWEIANAGHVDALMVALLIVGLWLAFTDRPLRGAAAIALGALVKPFALLALPPLWRPWDWRMPALVIGTAALCYAPYLSVGTGVFGFLATGYLQDEQVQTGDTILPLAAWRALFGRLPDDVLVYFAIAALVLCALAIKAAFRRPRSIETNIGDITSLLVVALLLLSPNHPWYFLVIMPFVALRGGAVVWAVSVGALLLHEEVTWDFLIPILVRKYLLYAAVLAACAPSLLRIRHMLPLKNLQPR